MAARSLSDGFVVRARVLGRVLGIRLLTLDASVEVAPAPTSEPGTRPRLVPSGARPRALGGGLADATKLIGEGEVTLAAARRNGASG